MTREELTQALKEIMAPYVQDQAAFEQAQEDTHLMNDLKINSQHLVDIILDVEDAFNIEIDDEAAERMMTVGAALDIIQELTTA
ncbi:phosphopantetheine-binding protein [Saprospira sp. CCB-QB6]|uniref:phosphopantetheine-binding protein n=1 Tax=Saprospira sp. CCB-QB6 TaxID=3023936 RepID=UPI00234AC367|nr:phosphopantetheine-binding protein [Saprospira sp. CCB-QB6]WCL81471.1 phosphopantetheine-binding protein [Saprospira sp. CCB-QB6]